jgi:hypothetical protein
MSNLLYNFFGGHDRQTLLVSVEDNSPDGNFDILGNFVYQRYEFHNQNFDFKTTKTLIFTRLVDFFQGGSPTKLWSRKVF